MLTPTAVAVFYIVTLLSFFLLTCSAEQIANALRWVADLLSPPVEEMHLAPAGWDVAETSVPAEEVDFNTWVDRWVTAAEKQEAKAQVAKSRPGDYPIACCDGFVTAEPVMVVPEDVVSRWLAGEVSTEEAQATAVPLPAKQVRRIKAAAKSKRPTAVKVPCKSQLGELSKAELVALGRKMGLKGLSERMKKDTLLWRITTKAE